MPTLLYKSVTALEIEGKWEGLAVFITMILSTQRVNENRLHYYMV